MSEGQTDLPCKLTEREWWLMGMAWSAGFNAGRVPDREDHPYRDTMEDWLAGHGGEERLVYQANFCIAHKRGTLQGVANDD